MVEDKKVACYVRASTTSQTKDDKCSIPEQIDILENICMKNNWDYDLYQDLGISGETMRYCQMLWLRNFTHPPESHYAATSSVSYPSTNFLFSSTSSIS